VMVATLVKVRSAAMSPSSGTNVVVVVGGTVVVGGIVVLVVDVVEVDEELVDVEETEVGILSCSAAVSD